MFLGCRGEANRPITLPSNWRSPVINFTLVSVDVSSSPLLSLCHSFSPILRYTSGYLLSLFVCATVSSTMERQKRRGRKGRDEERGETDWERGKQKEKIWRAVVEWLIWCRRSITGWEGGRRQGYGDCEGLKGQEKKRCESQRVGQRVRGAREAPESWWMTLATSLFLKNISIIVPCFTKTALRGWEGREEPCVCLLLGNALIYFRMQCLWSVVKKCVCSAKCILFIWVSVLLWARASLLRFLLCVCVCVFCWVFCLCSVHGRVCVCVCVMWVFRAGVRTEPRWRRGSRAMPAGGRTDGQCGGGMFVEGVRTHIHIYTHRYALRHTDNTQHRHT